MPEGQEEFIGILRNLTPDIIMEPDRLCSEDEVWGKKTVFKVFVKESNEFVAVHQINKYF